MWGFLSGNAGEVARGGARHRLAGSAQKVATPPGAEDLVVAVRLERGHDAAHPIRPERNVVGIAVHEAHVAPVLRHLEHVAREERPAPPRPVAQCSTVAPSKCPPQRTSVTPRASSSVPPCHSRIAGSGRMIQRWSAACRCTGTPPRARLHAIMPL